MAKRGMCLILLTAFLAGCAKPDPGSDQQVFRLNLDAGFTSMDPAFARNQANIWVTNQLFDGLVALNDTLQPVPAIAKDWQIDSSRTQYTFHLRQDVYFHPDSLLPSKAARKVTAHDFVYSFNRLLQAETASPGAWIFNDKLFIDTVNGQRQGSFKALNDSTLRIRLKQPFPPFLGLLTMQYCSVVPREVVAHYGKDFRRHPVGTGPFRLFRYAKDERLIMHRYDDYYGTDEQGRPLPYLDAAVVRFIPNKQNAFLAFMQGKLDLISGIDGSFKDNLLTPDGRLDPGFKGQFRMQKLPYLTTEYLGIQMDPAAYPDTGHPLQSPYVRQAINYGFDREQMLLYLRNDIGRPAQSGMVPPGLPAFDTSAVRGYAYNPEKASRLLRKAGYPQGRGMPTLTLNTTPTYLDLCLFIEKQLQELGIPLNVEVNKPSALRERMAQGKVRFFRGSWIADYPDAENYLALFASNNFTPDGPNYTRYADSVYDNLYKKAFTAPDRQARYKLYHRMENRVMQASPVIPLYYDEVIRLVQPDVRGLGTNAKNLLDLKTVKKKASLNH